MFAGPVGGARQDPSGSRARRRARRRVRHRSGAASRAAPDPVAP